VAEDTSPAEEAGTFLIRLGNADRKELERASSTRRRGRLREEGWRRLSQAWVSTSRKAQLCQQARAIVQGNAAQIQGEDRKFAIWAAHGVIVAMLAGRSAKRTDLRVLCQPFASCFGKRRFQRLGRTPTARRTQERRSPMAAVMCAAAVTTSATAGGRARQLSRWVGRATSSTSRPRDRGGQRCHLTARTVAEDVPHIAGNYVTGAATSMTSSPETTTG
jgi:hypothetical protein